MYLVIDNYGSFTFNLVQQLGGMGGAVHTVKNDRIEPEQIEGLLRQGRLSGIVISPGPGTPQRAGGSVGVVERFTGRIPILGVCLGHQCIAHAFGGEVVRAGRLVHGKASEIEHSGRGLFGGLESPLTAARYHSLIVRRSGLPDEIEVVAETSAGEIMALAHREDPTFGLQFRPESILTRCGDRIVANFMALCRSRRAG